MRRFANFFRDQRAAGAAEFALVLPVALLFLLGLIDVGRYAWAFNQAEKATQIGARWAAATTPIPGGNTNNGLLNYSFAVSSGVQQGTTVPNTLFDKVICTSSGGTASCTCTVNGAGSCPFNSAADQATFDLLANRMFQIWGGVSKDSIRVEYAWSGLGFSGDPTGPDIQPLITVSLENNRFPLWFILGNTVPLPTSQYTITAEDSFGTYSN